MLVYSKYLEELGVKKDDFPFHKPENDNRYELDKESGVVDAQTFSMDVTIIRELYTYLRYFQDNCMMGVPSWFVDESQEDKGMSKWKRTIQEMIDGLKAYHSLSMMDDISDKERDKLNAQFEKGWKLLGENMWGLWW